MSPTARVPHEARERHTGADFLAFLKHLARAYPKGEVHVILDSVSTHKTPEVRAWLSQHKRFVIHLTPTSASWMNQIEIWFGILSRQAIRRGSFTSVEDLKRSIDAFTDAWNVQAAPFACFKAADLILGKAIRKTAGKSDA